MPRYQCEKGCRDARAKDGRMWHFTRNECPAETYDPNIQAGRPGMMRAKGHPGGGGPAGLKPPMPGPRPEEPPPPRITIPASSGGGITFRDSTPAMVVKGKGVNEPVAVDYVVDGPHTKGLWNFGFRILYFGHVKVDEWVFDWHRHLPRAQFQLSKNAEMAIEIDPRNLYSRATTWFTKNICRCKTLEQAHAAIDSILFFEAFGGIFVALLFHYEEVYKKSPKMAKRRAEKAARAEAMKRARGGMMDTTGHVVGVTPEIHTTSTAGGQLAVTA